MLQIVSPVGVQPTPPPGEGAEHPKGRAERGPHKLQKVLQI